MAGSSLILGAGVLTASGLGAQVIGFVYRVLLSRTVGAETMGVYHLVMSAYSVMLSVCLTGLSAASLRLSAKYTAMGRRELTAGLVRRLIGIFFVLAGLCAALTLCFSEPIARYILREERARLGIVCLLPVLCLTGIENILKNHFVGAGRVAPTALCEVGEMAVRALAVFGVLAAVKPRTEGMAAACVVLGMVISEVFSASTLSVIYGRSGVNRGATAPGNREIGGIALPAALTSLVGTLFSSLNSVLIPARLALNGTPNGEAVSLLGTMFGMTLPLVTFPLVMLDGLGGVIVPELAAERAVGDREAVRRKTAKAFLAVCVYAIPASAIMIPLGPEAAKLLFGAEGAGRYIVPLCIASAIGAIRGMSGAVLNAVGEQGRAAAYFIAGSALQTAFILFGCPRFGMSAAAWGMAAAAAFSLCLNMARVVRVTGLRMQYVAWFICPTAAAAASALMVRGLKEALLPGAGALAAITVSALGGALLYILLLRAMGISHEQLFVLKRDKRNAE